MIQLPNWAEARGTLKKFFTKHPLCVSLYEAVFTFFVSNAALLFLVFTRLVDNRGAKPTISYSREVIAEAFISTEIFVYILALIAPALYVMVFVWQARRHKVFYFFLAGLQVAIVLGSGYIYGRAKSGGIANMEFVNTWALSCYVIGLLIWYVSLVYDKFMKSLEVPSPPPSGEAILRKLG
ncbi:MAG TPA: hypothetical protein VMF52_03370 [Steroidobacteraceae bacterium]|nr:hypothetical protein [Steroidobacteraceae bacterium]